MRRIALSALSLLLLTGCVEKVSLIETSNQVANISTAATSDNQVITTAAVSSEVVNEITTVDQSSIDASIAASIAEASSQAEAASIEASIADSIAASEAEAASIAEASSIQASIEEESRRQSMEAETPASQAVDPAADIAAQIKAAASIDLDYWTARRDPKVMYITIDDGPSQYTDTILDILDQYGVKATFFVCYSPTYEQQYRNIVERGHSIAIHSKLHEYDLIYGSYEAWLEDYTFMYNYIVEVTGVAPVAYRFPGGSLGPLKKHPEVKLAAINYLNSTGMPYFDWNIVNGDGEGVTDVNEQIRLATEGTLNRKHPMMLCHDSQGTPYTVQSLPYILQQYVDWGYSFARIDSTTGPIHQGTCWDY